MPLALAGGSAAIARAVRRGESSWPNRVVDVRGKGLPSEPPARGGPTVLEEAVLQHTGNVTAPLGWCR